jgi:hypothetical protein
MHLPCGRRRSASVWRFLFSALGLCLVTALLIAVQPQQLAASEPNANTVDTGNDTFNPYLDVVPSADGRTLFMSAGGVTDLSTTVSVNLDSGPGHLKRSYTMIFSDTLQSHVVRAEGFFPGEYAMAPITFATSDGRTTPPVRMNRHFIELAETPTLNSVVGDVELTIVSTDTFTTETYLTMMPGIGLPGDLPTGYQPMDNLYNVRASGDINQSNRQWILRMDYEVERLAQRSPQTLAVLAWNGSEWEDLGGVVFARDRFVSVATNRFTTFALAATNTWRDGFDTFSGLDFPRFVNTTVAGSLDERTLALSTTPGDGVAVSQPITAGVDFLAWGIIEYDIALLPAGTALTVDILSREGDLLAANVASGAELTGLVDPQEWRSLRLRANFSSTVAGASPELTGWRLSWYVAEEPDEEPDTESPQSLYLPFVASQ